MANDLVTTEQHTSGWDLPPLWQEKVGRGIGYFGTSALLVVGAVFALPFVVHVLQLAAVGALSLFEMGVYGVATALLAAAVHAFWPVYKLKLETLVRKSVWKIIRDAPLIQIEIGLDEKEADLESLSKRRGRVGGVIQHQEANIDDLAEQFKVEEKNFSYAVNKSGPDSEQALKASDRMRMLEEAKTALARDLQPLREVKSILDKIVTMMGRKVEQAKYQLNLARNRYESKQEIREGIEEGRRGLLDSSEKAKRAAMAADEIYRDFSESLGGIRELSDMTRDLTDSYDQTRGVYHQEALARLTARAQNILHEPVSAGTHVAHADGGIY